MEERSRAGIGFDPNVEDTYLIERLTLRRFPRDGSLDISSDDVDVVTVLAVVENILLYLVDRIMGVAHWDTEARRRLAMTTSAPRSQPLLEFLAFWLRIISEREPPTTNAITANGNCVYIAPSF